MPTNQTAIKFNIGVCKVSPGVKLPDGDPRWKQHTASFAKEVHTIASLAEAVAVHGYAISAVMKDDYRANHNFVQAQAVPMDFDGETYESSIDGLLEDPFIADHAAFIYETPSSTPEAPRSRVVFVLDAPITDPDEYCQAATALIHKFQTADAACKDASRFFYGRPGARHEVLGNVLYRDVLQEQVIEPYLRAKASGNGNSHAPIPGDKRLPSSQALDFVLHGAPIGHQRNRAVSAARSHLNAGYSIDETAAALWRGFQVCVQEPGKRPWTFKDAEFIAQDLEAHPLPPSKGSGPDPRGESGREAETLAPAQPKWPGALAEHAFYGLAGDAVRAISPCTESDPASLLLNFLTMYGNAVGFEPHATAEAARHGGNLNACIVGETSKARKGSSSGRVLDLMRQVDQTWVDERIQYGGLSSGEGLIYAVRDSVEKTIKDRKTGLYVTDIFDEGVSDKRLLVMDSEFAGTLKIMSREGNSLSAVIRQAWDSGRLSTLTKNNPNRATDAHISIIAHVSREELTRYMSESEAAGGFANRFLFCCSKRAQVLPEGGATPLYGDIVQSLGSALELGRKADVIVRDDGARGMWADVYKDLSEGKGGMFGLVTNRAEAQVLRLSVLYALLDCSNVVKVPHLLAAIAVWDYCESSAKFIFGDATGDPLADRILAALRNSEDGLSRTQISSMLGNYYNAGRVNGALGLLLSGGRAKKHLEQTEGKAREVWTASQ